MRTLAIIVLAGLLPLAGCDTPPKASIDSPMVEAVRDTQIHNGIIRQQTLFPYHFQVDSPQLNELGKHDLAVLAAHYRQCPGKLNIRRVDTPQEMYDARVTGVVEAMTRLGVPRDHLQVIDAPPSGEGMAIERIITILKIKSETQAGGAAPAEAPQPSMTPSMPGGK